MGHDFYIEIIGKCEFTDFLECYYKNECGLYYNDAPGHNYIKETDNFVQNYKFKLYFFNNLEISLFGGDFSVSALDDLYDSLQDEKYKNDENDETLVFCKMFLTAIKDNDPDLLKYYKIFNDSVDDMKIRKNGKFKFTIFDSSSYKGRCKLNIDYAYINKTIEKIRNIVPSIKIYTKLGQY